MQPLTPRQTEILKTIIQEYTQNGEPVGSEILDKKYNLGVSPATVRNEMIQLAKKGYLKKEHFSSGRIPTPEAFRFYIKNLMKEKSLSTAEEVSYKNDIWDFRTEIHRLLQNATRILAKRTNLLALATTNLGDVYYAGVTNILAQKEFFDIKLSRDFFERLDEITYWQDVLKEFKDIDNNMLFLLGEDDLKDHHLEPCASIFGEFEGTHIKGAIGVLGSCRIRYDDITPHVRHLTGLIGQIMKDQGL